jgi:tetratricopeptide (TPR) repeat protein
MSGPIPMAKKTIICVLVFWISNTLSFAQAPDSLLNNLAAAEGDKKVKALNELFRFYIASDPVKALGYTREALSIATEIKDEKGMAASYNNLGVAYRNQGALDKALEYYITSLKLYSKLDNNEGIATTKNNIANIYSIKKDYGQAMKYLEESYALLSKMGDKYKIIGSMNNLGNLYSDIQLYEKAQKYYSEAYQLSESNGLKYADPLNNLGNIYYRQNNFAKAIDYYTNALAIEKENNNRLGMLNLMINLGIAHSKSKEPVIAAKFLSEAEKLSNELQAYTSLPTIHKASADNFATQAKWKDAFEMQVKYDEAREKIYGEESSRNIAQMEMVMDFQEKEKEIEILKREDEIKTLELRNSRLFIILVILGVLVVLALVNLFYLDRKKKLITP